MKSGILTSIIMAIFVMLASGCASLDSRSQADKLDRTITHYGSALRWAHYRDAISIHVTRENKYAQVDLDELEKISITSFDIISKTIIPSSEKGGVNEAVIVSEVGYYNKDQGTLRELELDQIWWYNAEHKVWLIETDFPEFK